MPIGAGRQRDGVYYYGEAPLKIQSSVVKTSKLWHKRMEHPYSEVMSYYAKELGFYIVLEKKIMCVTFATVLNKLDHNSM